MSFEEGASSENTVFLLKEEPSAALLRSFLPCSGGGAPSKCPGTLHGWEILLTPMLGYVPPVDSHSGQGRSLPKSQHPCLLTNEHVCVSVCVRVSVCDACYIHTVKFPLPGTMHHMQ